MSPESPSGFASAGIVKRTAAAGPNCGEVVRALRTDGARGRLGDPLPRGPPNPNGARSGSSQDLQDGRAI